MSWLSYLNASMSVSWYNDVAGDFSDACNLSICMIILWLVLVLNIYMPVLTLHGLLILIDAVKFKASHVLVIY